MTLAHDVAGDGPVLLFLHSGVCDRRMWDAQWSDLIAIGCRLVRCDLRGFGGTPPADRPYNDADDVVDLLDALDIGETTLVGASYGGRVALEIAARYPERVSGAALLCSGLGGQEASEELRAFRAQEEMLIKTGDIAGAVDLNVDTWLGPEAGEAVRQAVRQMLRQSFDMQLAAGGVESMTVDFDLSDVEAPCVAVSGGHDLVDFRLIAARLAGLLPDARHLELPWAGHLPSLERPSAVTDLLVDFLRDLEAC